MPGDELLVRLDVEHDHVAVLYPRRGAPGVAGSLGGRLPAVLTLASGPVVAVRRYETSPPSERPA